MPTSTELPLVEVRPHNGAPALFIDGQPTFPLLIMTGAQALEELKAIAPCGIHLVTNTFELGWTGIDRYDFSAFDESVRDFLKADPQALLLPRLQLDAPDEWMDAHPDELVGYADPEAWNGDTSWGGARHPSFASSLWRKDVSEALRQLIRHVRESDYADHILGWHLGSGIYGEWHYWNAVYYPDTSPAFAAAYRDWLAQRYPGGAREPHIPTIAERREASLGVFRDPADSRWFIDHAEFFHWLGDQALGEFASLVKRETNGRSLVLAFNGYLPDLDVNQEIDHRAFEHTLRNPNVDSFASPHSYTRRAPGDDAPMRGFMGSVRAMGKLWFDEADERTSLAHPTQWKHVSTIEESVEVLWRSFANALTHNCGLWFMDQGGMWFMDITRGWYQDKAILDAFDEMVRVGQESMQRPRTRASEVAVVASFTNAFYLADRSSGLDQVTNTLINPTLQQFNDCGSPFDIYLISELFEPAVPEYKVYAFLDTFFLNDEELTQIKALRDAGKTILFFYAPGFLSENSISLERMRDLLGMDVQLMDSMILPDGKEQRPGFVVPGAEGPIARAGNVFYCAAPPLPAAQLRKVLHAGGVHTYLDTNDPLMVGGGYIAIHAATEGTKTIHNPVAADWMNVRTGETLAHNSDKLVIETSRGETLLLSINEMKR